jgi:hypothetical protein
LADLIAITLSQPSSYQAKLQADPDIVQGIAIMKALRKSLPASADTTDWAMLKAIDPSTADAMAATLRQSTLAPLERSIGLLLDPSSTSAALDTAWLLQIQNKPDEAQATLAKVAATGIPVPPVN